MGEEAGDQKEVGHKPGHKPAYLNFKTSTSCESSSIPLYLLQRKKKKASLFGTAGLCMAQCCDTSGSQQLLPLNPEVTMAIPGYGCSKNYAEPSESQEQLTPLD